MDSMITIVAPVRRGDVDALNAKIDALGNPCCTPVTEALDRLGADGHGTHFLSLHAIVSAGGGDAHLVFEITADGDAKAAIARIDAAIGGDLLPVFSMARDWRGNVGLAAYLESHRIQEGFRYSDPPGLCFAGTPHMSVKRIRDEAALSAFVSSIIDEDGRPDVRPIDRLATVRRAVAASDEFKWALTPPPPPGRGEGTASTLALVFSLLGPFFRTYLWPFIFVLIAALAVATVLIRPYAEEAWLQMGWDVIKVLALGFGATLLILVIAAALFYSKLRKQEESDWLDTRAPDLATLAEIRKRENFCAQNHMVSITERKPGFVRAVTLRLAFWIIAMFATKVYREGFLGGISTIHAARWITIPGTRTLVFFSNFGGSWESYLEDFITRAHEGLTAVWSNSIGFPRTRNLIQDGATDGERFKRYARASMQPTRFWYSAYPSLTTDHVRCNAALRRGLATALTNDEAQQWLALFGSGARPDAKLETSQIQSLVFGGLGFMKDGSVVLYNLPDDRARARAFMAGLYPHVGFGDGRKLRHDAIVTVALGPKALEKLGLPDDCMKGFAAAFLEGMSIEGRTRILGDIGKNAPENWRLGPRSVRSRSARLRPRRGFRRRALQAPWRARRRERPRRAAPDCAAAHQEAGDRAVRLRRRHLAAGHPRLLSELPQERPDPPRRAGRVHHRLSRQSRQFPAGAGAVLPRRSRQPAARRRQEQRASATPSSRRRARSARNGTYPRHPPARTGREGLLGLLLGRIRGGCRTWPPAGALRRPPGLYRRQAGRPLARRLVAGPQPLLSASRRSRRASRAAREPRGMRKAMTTSPPSPPRASRSARKRRGRTATRPRAPRSPRRR